MNEATKADRPDTIHPIMRRRVGSVACLIGLVIVAIGLPALAQDSCESRLTEWIATCPAIPLACAHAELCPPGSMVVTLGCDQATQLRVEVAPASPRAFRQVGPLALSPIGEFPDWGAAPAPMREHFEQFANCLAHNPTLLAVDPGEPAHETPSAVGTPSVPASHRAIPWFALVGTLAGVLAVARDPRVHRPETRRHLAVLVALAIATWWLRRWFAPSAAFHQNGQGPMWIGFALQPEGGLSPYGPGYWELFHAIARTAHNPDAAVRLAQSIGAACVPALVWVIARGSRADKSVSAALAGVVAIAPILARIGQSESYYATCTTLLVAAGALLAIAATARARHDVFVLATLGAACLVAEAARVNPVCWVAAAFLPAIVLNARARWFLVMASGLITALVVGTLTGRTLWAILHGSLGHRWLPQAHDRATHLRAAFLWIAGGVVFVLVLARDARAPARPLTVLAVASLTFEATRLIANESMSVNEAYACLWLPVLTSSVAGLAGVLRWRASVSAAGIAAAGLVFALSSRPRDFNLATDVLECEWAETWRDRVAPGSVVIYPGQGATYVLTLPLYGGTEDHRIEPWVLTGGTAPPPSLARFQEDVYYYESSMCSTREARGTCATMHAAYALTPVLRRTFPARSSDSELPFDSANVPVALYRIERGAH